MKRYKYKQLTQLLKGAILRVLTRAETPHKPYSLKEVAVLENRDIESMGVGLCHFCSSNATKSKFKKLVKSIIARYKSGERDETPFRSYSELHLVTTLLWKYDLGLYKWLLKTYQYFGNHPLVPVSDFDGEYCHKTGKVFAFVREFKPKGKIRRGLNGKHILVGYAMTGPKSNTKVQDIYGSKTLDALPPPLSATDGFLGLGGFEHKPEAQTELVIHKPRVGNPNNGLMHMRKHIQSPRLHLSGYVTDNDAYIPPKEIIASMPSTLKFEVRGPTNHFEDGRQSKLRKFRLANELIKAGGWDIGVEVTPEMDDEIEKLSQNRLSLIHMSSKHMGLRPDGSPVTLEPGGDDMIAKIEAVTKATKVSLFVAHFANALAKNQGVTRDEILNHPHALIGAITSRDWHYDQGNGSFVIDTHSDAVETIRSIFLGLFGLATKYGSLTTDEVAGAGLLIYNCGWYKTTDEDGTKFSTVTEDFPGFDWSKEKASNWLEAVIDSTVSR